MLQGKDGSALLKDETKNAIKLLKESKESLKRRIRWRYPCVN
jgi:chaperonin cofactor prefoldin